jgi:hypothetical protein
MKKILFSLVLVLSLVAIIGCASTTPVAATSNTVGSKTGTATEVWLLGLPPLMSASNGGIAAAAKNGGISKISTVDFKMRTIFLISWADTIVTGE